MDLLWLILIAMIKLILIYVFVLKIGGIATVAASAAVEIIIRSIVFLLGWFWKAIFNIL